MFFSFIKNGYSKIDTVDIKPPVIVSGSHCGEFAIQVTDDRSLMINQDTFQRDVGIIQPPVLLAGRSENISEIHSSTFEPGQVNYDFSFMLSVLNKYVDAKAVFFVVDSTNRNFAFDSVVYRAERIQLTPNLLSFGNVFINTESRLNAQIENMTSRDIEIVSIRLAKGILFSIVEMPKDLIISPDSIHRIIISFNPLTDKYSEDVFDVDTLLIETECLTYRLPMNGIGVKPAIIVEDIDFRAVEVGKIVVYNESFNPVYGKGLNISNPGSGKLIISGFYPLSDFSPFGISQQAAMQLNNFEINPQMERFINGITFQPTTHGEFFDTLTFKNNASGPDSVCHIRGIAYLPGPYLSDVHIGRVRVGDRKKGYLYLRNSGENPVSVSGFELSQLSNEFRIIDSEIKPRLSSQSPALLYPDRPEYLGYLQEIQIPVEFSPNTEFLKEIKVIPIFDIASGIEKGRIFNYVRGFGFKPLIEASGYQFPGKTLVSIKHPSTGNVSIASKSWSADLFIKSIDVMPVGFTLPDEFTFGKALPRDTSINILNPLEIPVSFLPREAGERQVALRIISDSYYGVDGSKWDTTFIYVTGTSYNKVISIENISIDSAFHCRITEGLIKIKNISDTTEAFIIEVKPVAGDLGAFTIDTDSIDNNFVILDPLDSIYLRFRFETYDEDKDIFELFLRVFSDVDTSTGIIRINTVKRNLIVQLPEIENTVPGAILEYNPPKSFGPEFEIIGDFTDLNEIDIYSFELEIEYDKKDLFFGGKVLPGDITSGWISFDTYETEVDGDRIRLNITARGSTSLKGLKGVLCKPVFIVLLGDSSSSDIELKTAIFPSAERCINKKLFSGKVRMSYCGEEVRKIVLSNRFYDLKSKTANPVLGGFAEISYTVALPAQTYIEVFNSFGESINLISDGFKESGTYTQIIDFKELNTGLYFVKMVSGPFAKSIKIMVVK
ncbi:MAG: hypothetical protein KF896_07620 [Ignavibacteriae bacterium]|nr:hypothetical protein [Ignavibacteriota bacterium]